MTIIRPLPPTFGLGQTSIASPILVRWWQMMARWNRLIKGSFLPPGRGQKQIEKRLFVEGKQTVSRTFWQTTKFWKTHHYVLKLLYVTSPREHFLRRIQIRVWQTNIIEFCGELFSRIWVFYDKNCQYSKFKCVNLGYRFVSKFYACYIFGIFNLTSEKGQFFWNKQVSAMYGQPRQSPDPDCIYLQYLGCAAITRGMTNNYLEIVCFWASGRFSCHKSLRVTRN